MFITIDISFNKPNIKTDSQFPFCIHPRICPTEKKQQTSRVDLIKSDLVIVPNGATCRSTYANSSHNSKPRTSPPFFKNPNVQKTQNFHSQKKEPKCIKTTSKKSSRFKLNFTKSIQIYLRLVTRINQTCNKEDKNMRIQHCCQRCG